MAALEQQALLERQQAQPSGQPSQQQPAKRHVPVFRSRAFQQQALPASAWPAESIEDADSDEEGQATAAAGPAQVAAAAGQQMAAGAVPQLGRRDALPLAGQAAAAAADEPLNLDGQEGLQAAAGPTQQQQQQQGHRGPAGAGAAGTGGQPAVQIDFSTIDVESLRPSVLLRWVGAGAGVQCVPLHC